MICVIAALLLSPHQAAAKSKKKDKPSAQDEPSGSSKPTKPAKAPKSGLDIPIPVNHDAKGIRIPSYDTAGKLQMFFNIDTAFRVDDRYLRMTNLTIETYGDTGAPDLEIQMPASLFDLQESLITSDEPITIRRSDFEITGSHATFDTKKRQGRFAAPVRMLIFNHDDL
jgi:hypothetical protein